MSTFKKKFPSLEDRKSHFKMLMEKHHNRIPVILSKDKNCQYVLNSEKYMAPCDIEFQNFILKIRNNISLKEGDAIYLLTEKGILPPISAKLLEVYNKHKDEDGFLYLVLASENAFGK